MRFRALRNLRRESRAEAYVFITERGGPMSTIGFHHLIQRLGKAAKMPFPLHPHMLRHACGYKLANEGTIPEPCSTTSATRTSSTPSDTPSFHPTGSGTSGEISVGARPPVRRISNELGCARGRRDPPVGGTVGF